MKTYGANIEPQQVSMFGHATQVSKSIPNHEKPCDGEINVVYNYCNMCMEVVMVTQKEHSRACL